MINDITHTSVEPDWSWHDANGFKRVINVAGTMTGLGASVASVPEVARETAAATERFVDMHALQTLASDTIAELTGAEAGCMTASAGAAISLAVAGCITGLDPAHAEALPRNPGPKAGIAVQMGHLCEYGSSIKTGIELAGANVRVAGTATLCKDFQLSAVLDDETAAALYVVSHHVVHYGQIPFERFVRLAHEKGVPVIVDAASEYDLRSFLEKGADLVIYSGHKFLGGPTSGIIAGRRDLVRACYLQNIGIGRGMKIGKESIMGAIAAMRAWMKRDHAAIRAQENAALELWLDALRGIPGISAYRVPDPTGNPLERLQIDVDAEKLGAGAPVVVAAFGQRDPAIIVRGHEAELGYFQLDPCNLLPGQAPVVANALREEMMRGSWRNIDAEEALASSRNGGTDGYLHWLS
ncbi:aminotransferase class V-fold PLP-dependent enzyme [Martelella mediterranea]|uniref:L-seryl-tRNA(Ser) seleniumtransferase n=1 Tax=Martelella mediterranea TaxID=293089 RepID=A0A4R3NYI0_9HYPH|nr:aminotransferase class V-fold PLP-dependent enzyme [Martelella mediterranea]TCT44463.1 L-seryl-tRNA(Ser) seleniumtransferase [Martelella mediterranea]